MKPLFCIDVTENKNNFVSSGAEFVAQETEEYLIEDALDSANNVDKAVEKSRMPLPIRILHIISALGSLIFLRVFLNVAFDGLEAIKNAFNNAPYIFVIGICCAVFYLVIFLLSLKKKKKVLSSEEVNNANNDYEKRSEAIYSRLNVPSDALKMDVMQFTYKVKKGEIQFRGNGMSPTPIYMLELRAFVEEENLFLASLEAKWSIPLTEIGEIGKQEKRIGFNGWNKEVPYDKGEYKQYKMGRDNYGITYMKSYYIVKINHNSEEFGLYLPCYEIENFKKLINRQ